VLSAIYSNSGWKVLHSTLSLHAATSGMFIAHRQTRVELLDGELTPEQKKELI
jgi:hypothetical protein